MGALAILKYHYSSCHFTYSVRLRLASQRVFDWMLDLFFADLCGGHCQAGSLAGAAHLLNDNAGVLRWAQWEQKSHVDKKGKSLLEFNFSTNTNCEDMAYRSFRSEKCSARGVRKVTTGITGLWQPSVHSDVVFWSFDVGSSYHWDAEVPKCRIVHPPIGNVSWFRPSWDRLVLPDWWTQYCDSNRS